MNILYVGPLNEYGTCYQRMRALQDLGNKVIPIDTNPDYLYKKQMNLLYRFKRKIAGPSDLVNANESIVDIVKNNKIGILWIDKGLTIRHSVLKTIKPDTVIVGYSPDDIMNPENQSGRLLKGLQFYHVFFTTKSYNVRELKGLGCPDVVFIENAYDPQTHHPVSVNIEERKTFGGTVGFIGSYEEKRAESIMFLAKNGIEIKIWGEWPKLWAHRLRLATVKVMGNELRGGDYARGVCSFDINLNFLRKINRDLQTTRSVEIPACGGFMLAERTEEHLSLFKEGVEAEYFNNNEELLNKIKYFLTHKERIKSIAAAGYERCIVSGYSNSQRLSQAIDYIQSKYKKL